jgi:hypothetical protein
MRSLFQSLCRVEDVGVTDIPVSEELVHRRPA